MLIVSVLLEPILHGGREQGLSPDEWQPEHAGAFLLNGIIISTVVPFTEELFFRGLGVRALRFLGGMSAVVITGLVFGFSHGILGRFRHYILFGIALGWVRLRSDSVWPGILAHGFYNAVGILIVYVQLSVLTGSSVKCARAPGSPRRPLPRRRSTRDRRRDHPFAAHPSAPRYGSQVTLSGTAAPGDVVELFYNGASTG